MAPGFHASLLPAGLLGLLVGAGLLAALGGDASISGAWDKKAFGCVCHTPIANASVLIDVQGFPEHWELGGVYVIDVRLLSTPVNSSSARRGGFNAEVSQGALAVSLTLSEVEQAFGNQASHRSPGTNLTNWTFSWMAPASPAGVVTLWVTVNTVNGNDVPDFEDLWTQVRLESRGPSPETSGGGLFGQIASGGPLTWVALGATGGAGAAALVFLMWRRSQRDEGAPLSPKRRRRAGKTAPREPKRPPRGRGRRR